MWRDVGQLRNLPGCLIPRRGGQQSVMWQMQDLRGGGWGLVSLIISSIAWLRLLLWFCSETIKSETVRLWQRTWLLPLFPDIADTTEVAFHPGGLRAKPVELGSLPAKARAKLFLNRTREDAAAASAADASRAPPESARFFIPGQTDTTSKDDYKSTAMALATSQQHTTVADIYLAWVDISLSIPQGPKPASACWMQLQPEHDGFSSFFLYFSAHRDTEKVEQRTPDYLACKNKQSWCWNL